MVRRTHTRIPTRPTPPAYRPMVATLVGEPFDRPGWVFEPKFDGLRVLVRCDGRGLNLVSRNDKPQEAAFPDVTEALRAALARPAVADGEIVCFDAEGRTSFRALQQRFHLTDGAAVFHQRQGGGRPTSA
jgi:bifunctional non-homologous end joining protein LigD